MLSGIFSQDSKFSRFMNFLWNVILISILWFLCSIPVITSGAASTAAYYAMSKTVRHRTGSAAAEFFASFRRNFRQATVFTLGYLAVLVILLLDCSLLFDGQTDSSFTLFYLTLALILMVISHALYVFPVLSRFDQSLFQHFRMAFVFVFRHLLTSVLMLLLAGATVLCVYWMPWGILIFPGAFLYLATYPVERVLLKYMPAPDEENEDKWYYQ